VIELQATSRLLLHPASNESVTDGSLLLHHTYGAPYLPGSVLKGVTRARLLACAAAEADRHRRRNLEDWADGLLGFVAERRGRDRPSSGEGEAPKAMASMVEFLDALWIPPERLAGAAERRSALALDVVNPHHPKYYTERGGGRLLPTDGDNPIPVDRLTVAPGARFLAVVEAPEDLTTWLDRLVDHILLPALAEDGLGAWTSAGYGRLKRVGAPAREGRRPPAASPEWYACTVHLNPGKGELSAQLPDGREATALRIEAGSLLGLLPESAAEQLRKRRQGRFEIQVRVEGRRLAIAALRLVGSDERDPGSRGLPRLVDN
jgi:CRISPR-associated protein Cmr6